MIKKPSKMNESNILNLTAEDSFAPLRKFKKTRLSRSQFGVMIDFMTLNPEIIHPRQVTNCSKEVFDKKWEELAVLLNADWTGPSRDPWKWRKTWLDQKCLIRNRAARRSEIKALTGNFENLNDLEERALKLISFNNEKKANCIVKKPSNAQNASHKIISPSSYIILGVGAENVPVSATQSSSKMEAANVLIGLEPINIVPAVLQSSNEKAIRVEETDVSGISASTSLLNKSHNISDIQESVKTSDESSETQKVEESGEKETSSLIVKLKPYEVSENLRISSVSENSQDPGKIEETMNFSVPNTSSSPLVKRRKLSRQSFFGRKNEITVAKLLQKQNTLLEGIAGTLARIEKSMNDRSSVEVQRKNNMIVNISENIERLAESLGSVSKSLKTIADS